MSIRCTLPVALISLLGVSMPLPTMSLQPGVYRTESESIQIARQGDRICLQGSFTSGTAIASVTPAPDQPNVYLVHGLADTGVAQQDRSTLLFGRMTRMARYNVEPNPSAAASQELGNCLNSQEPFFQRIIGDQARH